MPTSVLPTGLYTSEYTHKTVFQAPFENLSIPRAVTAANLNMVIWTIFVKYYFVYSLDSK